MNNFDTFESLITKPASFISNYLLTSSDPTKNNFLISFRAYFKSNPKPGVEKLFEILKSLCYSTNEFNLTEKFLLILFEIHSSSDFNSSLFLENYSKDHMMSIDPESIKTLYERFPCKFDEKMIISQAFYLLSINLPNKGVKLLRDFSLTVTEKQEKYDEKFNLIRRLISKRDIKNLNSVLGNRSNLLKKSVDILVEFKFFEHAENIIKENSFDFHDFPLYLKKSKKRSLKFFLNDDKLSISSLVDITENDSVGRSTLIEILLEKTSEYNWMQVVGVALLQSNYDLISMIDKKLIPDFFYSRKFEFLQTSDYFGPVSAGAISMPESVEVFIIDSEQSIESMEWQGNYVGIDSEWKTTIGGKFEKSKSSILQLAFATKVYIVDLLFTQNRQSLDLKLYELFGNSSIIKIGVSFEGDMAKFRESYPEMLCFQSPLRSYLDLIDVHKTNRKTNPGGLNNLCEIYYNQSLCKFEQLSNWESRPLRKRQIHYAALDAYICISLYYLLYEMKFDMQSDLITQLGASLKKGDGTLEKHGITCEICKSLLHDKSNCLKIVRCQICGFFDHETIKCQCVLEVS